MTGMTKKIEETVKVWLSGNYDEETKAEIRKMEKENPQELIECFYTNLEFGTGGLRGIMGVGTNRMNRYTVGMATQGLANYLKLNFSNNEKISVAIAYDCRNNNTFFANAATDVLTANGIHVYLFDSLRPTPELSFAIRFLGCQGGIVITASHNPKEYNGYKVYWEDGGQIISPHDKNIVAEAQSISSIDDVKFDRNPDLVHMIGEEIDKEYIKNIKSLSLSPEAVSNHKNMPIVYTPIHGTGVNLTPAALKEYGFENIIHVEEQDVVDGNFPTVKSPNPEEPSALAMAIEKAEEENATLVMATDPDADRIGIAVKNNEDEFELLNGNQTAAILTYYVLTRWKELGKITGKEFFVKTVVTTGLLQKIAEDFGVETMNVLTGFKYIADAIRNNEGEKQYIMGGEESYGYLVGDFVRDKDAVSAACMIAEAAAWAAEKGKTVFDLLKEIHLKYGFYKEHLISVIRKGKAGVEEIAGMMSGFRDTPPEQMDKSKVLVINDYLSSISKCMRSGKEVKIDLPSSNVLQFILENGSVITVRPSGTEPKIKFYFSVNIPVENEEDYEKVSAALNRRIHGIVHAMGLV